jgi:putative ABC transport system permease protein
MLRNYLATAWRSARRDRFYALLNLLGLALGFAAALVIGLYVRDELGYDRFLPGSQDVYRVQLTTSEEGSPPVTLVNTPTLIGPELKLDFPEIIAMARMASQYVGLRHGDVEATESVAWVDADFLSVLGYKLLSGDPSTALAAPDSIVLTRSTAEKYFGTIDCLGQTLEVNHEHVARVTGVAEDPPTTATVRFLALFSGKTDYSKLATLDALPPVKGELNITLSTFVRLRPGTTGDSLAARLPGFALTHYPSADGTQSILTAVYLNPLSRWHLHPYNPGTSEPDDLAQTVYAIAATGVLILLLAGVNFVNLVTARAIRRALEVGVRKAMGATRRQLLTQFMGEALGYAFLAMLLGTGLAALTLPSLDAFLDRHLAFGFDREPLLGVVLIAAALLFGLLAGAYPAFIAARFAPAVTLKARSGASIGGGTMRLALVVFQFAVTIALVIATIVIYRQDYFARTQALRFDTDLMLTVDLTGMPEEATADGLGRRDLSPVEALRTRIAAVPGVRSIAASFTAPLLTQFFQLNVNRAGETDRPPVTFSILPVDYEYFSEYRLPILAGRDFSRDHAEDRMAAEDKTKLSGAIINEASVRALGYADAEAAVGQELQSQDPGFPLRRHRIIGVVPDFPLSSIRKPVPPSIFIIDPDLFNILSIKLSGSQLPETLRGIDAAWHEFVPERPINRLFLDDRIAGLYVSIKREGRLFAAFASFAIAIGCLGLVGLSAYAAERRTKEIGIRKALGASTFDLARLLVWQFARPVLLANLLAWPIAWWFMRRWLDGFAYRIDLDLTPFIAAGFGAVVIAVATTSFHALRVARSPAVSALRYE